MGVSCGAQLIKIVLFVFNLLWLVLGGVVIWLGVTIASWSGDLSTILNENMKGGAVAVLVAGALIFVIAFLGCCGACKENSCMLSTYGGIILILVVIQCVGVYFAFKYRSNVEDTVADGIQKELSNFSQHKDSAQVLQSVQKTFKCCGNNGPSDYDFIMQTNRPSGCCGEDQHGDDPRTSYCQNKDNLYKDGCGQKLKDTLQKYLGGMAGVAIALILVQLLIILMACCLSREVRN